ncbi:oligosaccharide MFS transporter [Buttiauxella massiliensis]|uniref:oligosaccharide MFS transporter n=1 Tax=Buttiauxella massiliensis TaxID=2831590 RepID=UPI00125FC583|nr:oligosaccharide MFS transporter [Buttiauxella massiliensis]
MIHSKRNYITLSIFDFLYLFTWSAAMSFFVIWLNQALNINSTNTGFLYMGMSICAMVLQPFFGYISDKFGLRKNFVYAILFILIPIGPFFIYVYAPLLVSHFWIGLLIGSIYLSLVFNAGYGVIDSYIDKVSRKCGFEYGRVRMWGSLGWAAATFIVGRAITHTPDFAFWFASASAILALIFFWLTKVDVSDVDINTSSSVSIKDVSNLIQNKQFWYLLVFGIGVSCVYEVYDQQFGNYFVSFFASKEEGNKWFGDLASVQVVGETIFLCLMPFIVNKFGAKNCLILAGFIMSFRIIGSAMPWGTVWIAAMKMLHAIEKPLIVVTIFKYISFNFNSKMASTTYLSYLFSMSLATAILSPIIGHMYEVLDYRKTYMILGVISLTFTTFALLTLKSDKNSLTKEIQKEVVL